MEEAVPYIVAIVLICALVFVVEKVPRTKGTDSKKIQYHIAFLALALLFVFVVPESIQILFFCPAGVLLIGTLIPIYESIKAIVSIDEEDDVAWLQFWVTSGTFTYLTEWMDVVSENYPGVAEHWYQIEFMILLWLLIPFTNGASLLFNVVTKPLLGPLSNTIKNKVEGKLSILSLIINSGYLWIIWFTFLTLDEEAKRSVVIAVGTVYPIAASTVACASSTDGNNRKDYADTFWLTYWVCFSILFLAMDYLENFVGTIPGFYSVCLCANVYLFLPMFKGADVVFRNVLVPLSGQYEHMLLRDVNLIKRDMMEKIPHSTKRDAVFANAANIFAKNG